jgi:hypothetical protein
VPDHWHGHLRKGISLVAGKKHVVVAPYVQVRTAGDNGPTVKGLYAGAPWPQDADPDVTERHVEDGLIVEVDDPAAVSVESVRPTPAEAQEMYQSGRDPLTETRKRVQRQVKDQRSAADKAKEDKAEQARKAAEQAKGGVTSQDQGKSTGPAQGGGTSAPGKPPASVATPSDAGPK